jgi:hypothetical protein
LDIVFTWIVFTITAKCKPMLRSDAHFCLDGIQK